MKVAFDVKGTLEGHRKVLALYLWFESKGCEMIIWSSVYSYAVDCARELKLDGEVMSKREKSDFFDDDNSKYDVNIAVDDRDFSVFSDGKTVSWLACNHLIKVNEIPSDLSKFESHFGHFFKNEARHDKARNEDKRAI